VDKERFEKDYRTYIEGVARGLGTGPLQKEKSLADLQKAHTAKPDDADVAAQLAERYLQRRRNTDARKLVDGVLAKDGGHALALYVRSRLLLAAGEEDEAQKLLEKATEGAKPEPKALLA